jgi:hypothetical protein
MKMKNEIVDKLKISIESSSINKSSFWEKIYKNPNMDYLNPLSDLVTVRYYTKTFYTVIVHFIFLSYFFGQSLFKLPIYKKYKLLFDNSKRQIDLNTVRHILTFNLLKKRIKTPSNVCIIGDGKCHALIGSMVTFPNARIFSINLSETLINDYLVLRSMNILDDAEIQVIESEDDEILENKKLILIPSHLKKYLLNKHIDLFVNIASFQEMTTSEVANYFEIIKSNNSVFYCCNREYKKLDGGEELYFEHYPWGEAKFYLKESCPWHQKYYCRKFPFIKKYNGVTKHCLVSY